MRKENENIKDNTVIPEACSRESSLSVSFIKEEKQAYCMREAENPQTLRAARLSGMTSDLMGFTLIELLVVVLVIGILAAVALPQYEKAVEKTRAAEGISLLESLGRAEQIYKLSEGQFTNDSSNLDIEIPLTTKNFTVSITSGVGASPFTALATGGKYTLHLSVADDGTEETWCAGNERLCKAIGGICTGGKKGWCYYAEETPEEPSSGGGFNPVPVDPGPGHSGGSER